MDYSLLDMLGFRPYDPEQHSPVDLPNNGTATEYTMASQLEDGTWVVHPQIWWDADGRPRWLGEQSLDMALVYEANTGQKMPRFASEEDATSYAEHRSSAGGGTKGGIADISR